MASILKVDDLRGNTSAGDITVTGEGTATMQLQQGLAKVWSHFQGSGTATVLDSFNQSSLTDSGTGQYKVNKTNNMGSVNYSTPCQSAPTSGGSTYALGMIGDQYTAKTTSSSLFLFLTRSSLLGDSYGDTAFYDMAALGDLA